MEQRKSWDWDDFDKLENIEDLEDYFHGKKGLGREFEHTNYFHYTSLYAIDGILKSQCFWLSSVCNFNDTLDRDQFGDEKDFYFGLCFSTGVHENLPMWYFYSGIDGKGARLRMTSGTIRKLMDEGRWYFVTLKEEKEIDRILLEQGRDMEISFRDVIYANTRENNKSYKYNTMTNYKIPLEEFKAYDQAHRGFRKELLWYYEKETRILVRVKGEAEKRLRKWRETSGNGDKVPFRVELKFSDKLLKSMKICLAPAIEEKEKEELLERKQWEELRKRSALVELSKYAGTVKMNCCKDCKTMVELERIKKKDDDSKQSG